MGRQVVAVDVGGTFTDVCVLDDSSEEIRVAKVPSTADPIEGVLAGVEAAEVDLADVALFSHGTTVATNALITRRFPPAAMVTTAGFRDVLEIRRGTRDDLWDAYKDVAPPYIRRRDRFEVAERVDHEGTVVTELDEDGARHVAELLRRKGVETVAVCFINAFANPAHEQRMAEILRAELPDVSVSTSSEVLPEIFEHERFSTTVANAVLSPLVGGYVSRLADELSGRGYEGDLLLLHSGGGVMTPKTVERLAVRLAASGIAAGAIAARHIAALCGHDNAIGLDMGGTSTDISIVHEGEAKVTKEWFVEYGYPIRFPSIEVLTIGAGGGSLAWIDEAGSLRNGPQSAGADPGPACYGKGGEEPTNTDANLVLGRLGDRLIGGEMTLERDAAEQAIRGRVAEPLGLGTAEAATAIIEVANANMADAVRLMSIRKGYDPREFALVVFGGAGPLHGADLARELGIPTVIVPPNPGVTSALGCLLVDVRHDLSEMFSGRAAERRAAGGGGGLRPAGGRGARAAAGRGRLRGPHDPGAHGRHALRRPVALAARRGRGPGRLARRGDRALPSRARARARLPARRHAGRDLPAQPAGHRRDAQGRAPCPRARRRRPARAGGHARRALCGRGRGGRGAGAAAREPRRGRRVRRPGARRPARLDGARAARGALRGRRVAEHPHAHHGGER